MFTQTEIDDDLFARPPRRVAPSWVAGRSITCRVHHLPAPSNPRGVLLCQDCLADLDAAAQHIAELRETTSEAWADYLISLDAATFEWWEKMQRLDPLTFAGKCALALEKGGRGASVVAAWRAKEDALTRCDQAAHEIATARETHHGAI